VKREALMNGSPGLRANEITEHRILRGREVAERTQLSRVQRWRLVRAGTFPAPVQLGRNSIGWFEEEVEAWLASRPRVAYGRAS
jgi:prophage regulatory protein